MNPEQSAPTQALHSACSASGFKSGVLLAAIALGLGACSSKPAHVTETGSAQVAGAKSSGVVCRPISKGGAFYLDDGPGECIPADLDAIPDAVPRIEPLHPPALKPYTVMGQQFVPRTELAPYRERGHASWYGRRFHGNPTSIGEPYDMFAMTAAHPTLPIPSYARVTNLANGRTVVVRVNDRGPFLRGRLIDLSYAGAYKLGYVNSGSASVEVESILPDEIRLAQGGQPPVSQRVASQSASPAPMSVAPMPEASPPPPSRVTVSTLAPLGMGAPASPVQASPSRQSADMASGVAMAPPKSVPVVSAPAQAEGAFVQLGAFSTPSNADDLVGRVRSELGYMADRLQLLSDGGRYRLQIGPFASADEARAEAGRIGSLLNLQPFVVMR